MSTKLEEYRDTLAIALPSFKEKLGNIFQQAGKHLSPFNFDHYLSGAAKLAKAGRSNDLIISYLEEIPAIAKSCDDNTASSLITTVESLSTTTSSEVVSHFLSCLPATCKRLDNNTRLTAYLTLIQHLAVTAPRALRPLLFHLDELLAQLTIKGLDQWARFGAETYARDYINLVAYFSLQSPDSKRVLQQQRSGTLLTNVQRKLELYLRALWGHNFSLHASDTPETSCRQYIDSKRLYLPDAINDEQFNALDLYRAMTTHMAAHIHYGDNPIDDSNFSPLERYFIGLLEDARIEHNAIQVFPGLKRLWSSHFEQNKNGTPANAGISILQKIILILMDDTIDCDDTDINSFGQEFHSSIAGNRNDANFSIRMGTTLSGIFRKRGYPVDLESLNSALPPYRDDNRFVWKSDKQSSQLPVQTSSKEANSPKEHFDDSVFSETLENASESGADETTILTEQPGGLPAPPSHYPEWDYLAKHYRPDWTTIHEYLPIKGNARDIDNVLSHYKSVSHRIKKVIDKLKANEVQRLRRIEDGDEIDLDAAIETMMDLRQGKHTTARVYSKTTFNQRDLAVLVLLDLSQSTNDRVKGSDKSIIDLTREASVLLATAIDGVNDPFAIHGFSSNGRHDVRYLRFKDFDQKFDDEIYSRLAGMQGGLSTRMGAALRHAGQQLLKQPERRKLLLIVTDGEPSDIDERNPQHLILDARKATEELFDLGITPYCLTVDTEADRYVQQIFNARNYTIIDKVHTLPEKLPELFTSLTK